MDYSYIFRSAVPDYSKFQKFGFEKHGDAYVCKKPLSENGFYTLLNVNGEKLSAEVYESDDDFADSKYALFDVESANGSFVSQIRTQVQNIVEDFRLSCFESNDLHKKYTVFLQKEFNCKPDFPWTAPENSTQTESAFKSERYEDYAYHMNKKHWITVLLTGVTDFDMLCDLTRQSFELVNGKKKSKI